MDGYFFLSLPAKKRQPAMGTEELGLLVIPEAVMDLEEMTADLALDL